MVKLLTLKLAKSIADKLINSANSRVSRINGIAAARMRFSFSREGDVRAWNDTVDGLCIWLNCSSGGLRAR